MEIDEKAITENYMNRLENELLTKFSRYIDGNFLLRIEDEILHDSRFRTLLNKGKFNKAFDINRVLNKENLDYIVCEHITMINFYYDIAYFGDEQKISSLYTDDEYVSKLKDKVFTQLRFKTLFDEFGEDLNLLSFMPLFYTLRVVDLYLIRFYNHLVDIVDSLSSKNKNFKLNLYLVLLQTIKSIIMLCEERDYGNAYALLRSLVQNFVTYLAIGDNEEAAHSYNSFLAYRILFDQEGSYPKEFLDSLPDKIKNGRSNYNKINRYLDYGWLDSLGDKHKNYNFRDVLLYVDSIDDVYKDSLIDTFKECCKFSHGNYLTQEFDPYAFFDVLHKTGCILGTLFDEIIRFSGEKHFSYENINLRLYLKNTLDDAVTISDSYMVSIRKLAEKAKQN